MSVVLFQEVMHVPSEIPNFLVGYVTALEVVFLSTDLKTKVYSCNLPQGGPWILNAVFCYTYHGSSKIFLSASSRGQPMLFIGDITRCEVLVDVKLLS